MFIIQSSISFPKPEAAYGNTTIYRKINQGFSTVATKILFLFYYDFSTSFCFAVFLCIQAKKNRIDPSGFFGYNKGKNHKNQPRQRGTTFMWKADNWKDYEIIDCAKGEKLERWGDYLLIRPDPQVIWDTKKIHQGWKHPNGHYHRST